jgi:hypothetical protein
LYKIFEKPDLFCLGILTLWGGKILYKVAIFFLGVRATAQPTFCDFWLFVAISLFLSFELIRQESDGY